MAMGRPVFLSKAELPLSRDLTTEYVVIDSTVHPERKLMVDTPIMPKASRAGLIMTPPPIPQMAPTTEAKKQIRNTRRMTIVLFILSSMVEVSSPIPTEFVTLMVSVRSGKVKKESPNGEISPSCPSGKKEVS